MACDAPTLAAAAVTLSGMSARALLAAQTARLNTNPSGPAVTPNSLVDDSRGFRRYSARDSWEVDTYLLAVLAGGSTDPETLMLSARAFESIPSRMFFEVKAYYIAVKGGGTTTAAGLEISAAGYAGLSVKDHHACQTYCLAVIAGGSTVPATLLDNAGAFHAVSQRDIELLQMYLLCQWGSGGACVDVPADLIPVVTPHYVSGVLNTIDILFPAVCCDPGGYNIYGLPGDTFLQSGTLPGAVGGDPYLVLGLDVSGLALASDWADRVETNGGVRPSQNSIDAAQTFLQSLNTAGILSKMIAVNMFAPDNLIAAITPLVVGPGLDPWTNQGGAFVLADLTVNGLKGDGSTKILLSGIRAWPLGNITNNPGYTVYTNLAPKNPVEALTGAADDGNYDLSLNLQISPTGIAADIPYAGGSGRIFPAIANWIGYISANRTAANLANLFIASSGTAHQQLGTNANVIVPPTLNKNMDVFGANFGPNPNRATNRISFVAFHHGLTQAESSDFFNAVQALRTSFGGGFV